jgi:methionyl-tRNA formyltransferase
MNWSLIEDMDRFLLSVIKLDEGVDSGEIVDTKKFDITEFDTIRTLYYKLSITTTDILLESLGPILRGEFNYTSQVGNPTYYPKREPDDGKIHWGESTSSIYNLIRAVSDPYPGAFSQYDGERIYIWKAVPFSQDLALDASSGEIIQVFETTDEFVVGTADGTLLIREWTAEEWTPSEGQVLNSLGEYTGADRKDHD